MLVHILVKQTYMLYILIYNLLYISFPTLPIGEIVTEVVLI
jgi:hypothetical protein